MFYQTLFIPMGQIYSDVAYWFLRVDLHFLLAHRDKTEVKH